MSRRISPIFGTALSILLVVFPGLLRAQDDVPEIVKTLLADGNRHRQAGRTEEAIASYEEARRLDPAVVGTYVALGALYHGRGDLEKALEVFESGLGHDPGQPNLLFNAAVASLGLGRYAAALDYVDRALGHNRRDAGLLSVRSAVLRELGRLEEALAAQQSAAKLDSGDPQVLFRLGNLYYELDRKDEAIDAYRKAIRKDKDYLRAWYNLGAALYDENRFDEALEAYLVALEPVEDDFAAGKPVDPENARAYLNLGAIYFQKESWQGALDAYGKALELDPEQSGAHYNRGYVYYRLGRVDDAFAAYERALALDPELPLAYLHLGEIHFGRGAPDRAIPLLERAARKLDGEERRKAYLALAESHRVLGQTGPAKEAYGAVLAEDPDELDALAALGRILAAEGDTESSRRLLERARSIAPGDSGVLLELAALARSEGDRGREKALYEDLLRRSGSEPRTWPVRVNLARVLVEEGDDAGAREVFAPVVERLPELRRSGLGEREAEVLATVYGLLLAADGRLGDAAASLRPLVREGTAYVPAREAAAVLDAVGGEVAAAAGVLAATFPEHAGKPFESAARANLGQMLWLAGRSADARGYLEQAARAFPADAALKVALGEIAFTERRWSEAVEWLEAASSACGQAPAPVRASGRELRVRLGPAASPALCERASRSLATALAAAAFAELRESPSTARSRADHALELPLAEGERAIAYLVRGTAQLAAGADRGASADLVRALEGLPENLRPLAENNLGVARYRLGEIDEARRHFESSGPGPEPTLNLGILLDDEAGDEARALELYEAYLARRGRRRAEVEAWVERLKKVYE